MQEPKRFTFDQRLVLLLGPARSGTTWLAQILNSSPRALYSHEPLSKLTGTRIKVLVEQIKQGQGLAADERAELLWHWSRAYHALCRPPFFSKQFSLVSPLVRWGAWLTVSASDRGYGPYRRLFSPARRADFDLVVKQGFSGYATQFVEAMKPAAVIAILRHPCAVISSLRRGRKLQLMDEISRHAWLDDHRQAAGQFGYEAAQVEQMSDAEFESLRWLIESSSYVEVAEGHPNGQVVTYQALCNDPTAVTEQLFALLGWPMKHQTRRFIAESTGEEPPWWLAKLSAGNRYFSVYRPRVDALFAWKRELPQRDCDEILAVARPLVERFWPEQPAAPVLS